MARAIVDALVTHDEIEVSNAREAALDVEAVLRTYISQEQEVAEDARDLMRQRNLPQREFGRIKQLVAERRGIQVGDEGLDYVLEQLLQMLMHSANIDEIYAEDHELKRRMRAFLRQAAEADDKLEAEIRQKLKHVEEGSRMWEIEYHRMKADIRRRRGG